MSQPPLHVGVNRWVSSRRWRERRNGECFVTILSFPIHWCLMTASGPQCGVASQEERSLATKSPHDRKPLTSRSNCLRNGKLEFEPVYILGLFAAIAGVTLTEQVPLKLTPSLKLLAINSADPLNIMSLNSTKASIA